MSLTSIPPELRLHIYEHVQDLQPTRINLTTHSRLTPAISRTCRLLRVETLPIYAANPSFVLPIDFDRKIWPHRILHFVQGLGPYNVQSIRHFEVSCHWDAELSWGTALPTGFSVQLANKSDRGGNQWRCLAGIYCSPYVARGDRLLQQELTVELERQLQHVNRRGLRGTDLWFIVRAMIVVATLLAAGYDFIERDHLVSTESAKKRVLASLQREFMKLRTTIDLEN